MKLHYLAIVFIGLVSLFSQHASAQGTPFSENFNGQEIHPSWRIENNTYPPTADQESWASGGSPNGYIGAAYDSENGWFSDAFGNLALTVSGISDFLNAGGFLDRSYGYASVGYAETDYDGAHISKWLISPVLHQVKNGDVITFWTRARSISAADRVLGVIAKDPNGALDCDRPNKLEVRAAIVQNSNDPTIGSNPSDVGPFTILLRTVGGVPTITAANKERKDSLIKVLGNPFLSMIDRLQTQALINTIGPDPYPAYPSDWTKITITLGGLPNGQLVDIRLGFWYHFENGGYNNCRTRLELGSPNFNLALSGAGLLPGPIGEAAGAAGDFVSFVKTVDRLASSNQKGTNGSYIAIDDLNYSPKQVSLLRELGTNKVWYEGYGSKATEFGYTGSSNCPTRGKSTAAKYQLVNRTNQRQRYFIDVESGSKPDWFTVSPRGSFISVEAGQSLTITVTLKDGLSPNPNPNIPEWSYLMIKEDVQNGRLVHAAELKATISAIPPPVARCKEGLVELTLNDSGVSYLTNPASFNAGSTVACGKENDMRFYFTRFGWGGDGGSQLLFNCNNLGFNTVFLTVSHPAAPIVSRCPITVHVKASEIPNVPADITYYLKSTENGMPLDPNTLQKPSYQVCPAITELISIYKNWDTTINYRNSNKLGLGSYTATWNIRPNYPNSPSRRVRNTITVIDTIKPVAICFDTTRIYFTQVRIMGLPGRTQFKTRDDISAWRDVGPASYDNMQSGENNRGITKYTIYSPWYSGNVQYFADSFEISCNEIGLTFPVTLKLTDQSFNTSTCQTIVKIMDPSVAVCKDATIRLNPTTGQQTLSVNDVLLSAGNGICGANNLTLSRFNFTCADTNKTFPVSLGYRGLDNVVRGCVANVTVKAHSLRESSCEDTVKIYLTGTAGTKYFKEFEPLLETKCGPQVPWSMWENNIYYPSINGNKIIDFPPGFKDIKRTSVYQNETISCNQVYAVYDNTPPAVITPVSDVNIALPNTGNDCFKLEEIPNPFQQPTYDKWSYSFSGATNKTVVITTSDYSYWLPQWDSIYPGITKVTLTAEDLAGNTTTLSYTINFTVSTPIAPYVGLPLRPGYGIGDTTIVGDLCGETTKFTISSPVNACPQDTSYMWYYEVRDGYMGNIIYERDSISQKYGADIPIRISPKLGQDYLQTIHFGYHSLNDGSKRFSTIYYARAIDTASQVIIPENSIVQSANDSTFTVDYTIPSPLNYSSRCSGSRWGYKVTGATNTNSTLKPGVTYSQNQLEVLAESTFSPTTAYPSIPSDSDAVVKLNIGENTIEYTILEQSGIRTEFHNYPGYRYTVTVRDTSSPVMVCPENDTIYRSVGSCSISTLGSSVQVNGFTGPFGQTRLNLTNNNPNIRLNKSTAPDSITFISTTTGGYSLQDGFITFIFNASGTVSFNWEYRSVYPTSFRPFLTLNAFNPRNFNHPLLPGFNQNNLGVQTGTYSQTVSAGDVLRIGLNEANASGYFKIMNFSAPASNLTPLISTPTFADNAALFYKTDMSNNYPVGTHTIRHTLTNVNSNRFVTCDQKLTVWDNFATSLNCINDTLYLNDFGEAGLTPERVLSTSCFPTTSTTLNKSKFTKADIGTQNVSITSLTQLGDTVSCNFQITVLDKLPPRPLFNRITLPLSDLGSATISDSAARRFFYDNCAIMTITLNKTNFGCGDVGRQNITAFVADSNGNSATYTIEAEITPGFAPTTESVLSANLCSNDSITLLFQTQPGYSLTYQWQEKENTDSVKHWNYYTCTESQPFLNGSHLHQFFQYKNETYVAYRDNDITRIQFMRLDTFANNWRPALSSISVDYFLKGFKVYITDEYIPKLHVGYIDGSGIFHIKQYQTDSTWFTFREVELVDPVINGTGFVDYFNYPTAGPPGSTTVNRNFNMEGIWGNGRLMFPVRNSTVNTSFPNYEVFNVGYDTLGYWPRQFQQLTGDTVRDVFNTPFPRKRYDLSSGNSQVTYVTNGKNILGIRNNLANQNRFFSLNYAASGLINGKDSISIDPTNGSALFTIESFNNKDHIAYKSSNGKICVKRYEGPNNWTTIGSLDFSENEISKLDIKTINNQLYLLYLETTGRIVVKQLQGNNWLDLGSPNTNVHVNITNLFNPLNIVNINNTPAIYFYNGSSPSIRLIRLDQWKTIPGATNIFYKPNVAAGGVHEYRCVAGTSCIAAPSQIKKVSVTQTPVISMLTKRQIVVKDNTAELRVQLDTGTVKWQYGFSEAAALLSSTTNLSIPRIQADTIVFAYAQNGNCYSDTVQANIYKVDSNAAIFTITVQDTACTDDYIQAKLDTFLLGYKYSLLKKDSTGVFQSMNYDIRAENPNNDVSFGIPITETAEYKIKIDKTYRDAVMFRTSNTGYDNFVDFGSLTLPIANNLTVEAWIRPNWTTDPFYACAIQHSKGTSLETDPLQKNWEWAERQFRVYHGNKERSLQFPTLPSNNQWIHVSTTADSNGLYIYYNGVLVASSTDTASANINTNACNLLVGANKYKQRTDLLLGMDEFRVWNTTRTATEIASSYNACLNGTETGLLVYNTFSLFNFDSSVFSSTTGPNARLRDPDFNNGVQMDRNLSCIPQASPSIYTTPFTITALTNQPRLLYYDDQYEQVQSGCAGELIELTAIGSAGTSSITWYNAFVGGDIVGTGNTLHLFVDKDTILYPAVTNSVCQRGESHVDMEDKPYIERAEVEEPYCYNSHVYDRSIDIEYNGDGYRFYDSLTGVTPTDWDNFSNRILTETDTVWIEAYNSDWVDLGGGNWGEVINCVSAQRKQLILPVNAPNIIVSTHDSTRYGEGPVNLKVVPGKDQSTIWFDINNNYIGFFDSIYTTPSLTSTTQYLVVATDQNNSCDWSEYDTVTAFVYQYPTRKDTVIACESYTWEDGNTYTFSDSAISRFKQNMAGVDSLIMLHLTIINFEQPTIQVGKTSMCSGDSTTITVSTTQIGYHYMLLDTSTNMIVRGPLLGTGNNLVFNTGALSHPVGFKVMATDTASVSNYTLGCTKQVGEIAFIHAGALRSSESAATCGSFIWQNQTYTESGIYYDTLNSTQGCDSVISINLTIFPVRYKIDSVVSCGPYTWNGITYTSSTQSPLRRIGFTEFGCDSFENLHLTINSNAATDTQTQWDSYTWINGVTYTNSTNTPTFTLNNSKGCDSVVTLNLRILKSVERTSFNPQTICGGESYTFNGNTYTVTGTYRDTIFSATGRDSIVATLLTVNTVHSVNNPQAICSGSSYTFNGHTYTSSGNYRDTLLASTGCDSIIVTQLTVNPKPVTSVISGQVNPNYNAIESYSVLNTPGSTYTWFITNGTQITGGNTNSITVQWGAVLGNTTVKVIETTVHGCFGDTVSQQVTLPVTLLSFGAYKTENDVDLRWETASELNNKGFHVERSLDGRSFETIGFVKGNGTTNKANRYTFKDAGIVKSASSQTDALYYRLRQVDLDGKYEYTAVVFVELHRKPLQKVDVLLIPNPFQSGFTVSIESNTETIGKIDIYDALGKLVRSIEQSVNAGNTIIPVTETDDWRMGLYFVTVTIDGEQRTYRLAKN